jgi:predicted nuclease with TOPRIM domain
MEKQAYANRKNKLDNEYNGKKADLKKVYEKKAKDLEEEYYRKECDFGAEKLRILNLLPKINKLATELHDDLVKRFFMPKHAVELAESIINTTKKYVYGTGYVD